VVRAVVDVWGADRVGIRLSPATTQPGGAAIDSTVMETYGTYLDELSALGLAYTHFIEGVTYTTHESPDEIDFAELRRRSPGAYIANNELSVEDAERMLEADEADLISFARAYIANPDLVERIRSGAPLAEAPQEYWYGGDETGYSDWPAIHPVAAD
jgi:N-ethylmaleimide reductase